MCGHIVCKCVLLCQDIGNSSVADHGSCLIQHHFSRDDLRVQNWREQSWRIARCWTPHKWLQIHRKVYHYLLAMVDINIRLQKGSVVCQDYSGVEEGDVRVSDRKMANGDGSKKKTRGFEMEKGLQPSQQIDKKNGYLRWWSCRPSGLRWMRWPCSRRRMCRSWIPPALGSPRRFFKANHQGEIYNYNGVLTVDVETVFPFFVVKSFKTKKCWKSCENERHFPSNWIQVWTSVEKSKEKGHTAIIHGKWPVATSVSGNLCFQRVSTELSGLLVGASTESAKMNFNQVRPWRDRGHQILRPEVSQKISCI